MMLLRWLYYRRLITEGDQLEALSSLHHPLHKQHQHRPQ